jgi:hypothetical protein
MFVVANIGLSDSREEATTGRSRFELNGNAGLFAVEPCREYSLGFWGNCGDMSTHAVRRHRDIKCRMLGMKMEVIHMRYAENE